MWDALKKIYGGDKNVLRAKAKSLRGKFDEMRVQGGETMVHYCARIKDVVNAIKGANEIIDDETMIKKSVKNLTTYLYY